MTTEPHSLRSTRVTPSTLADQESVTIFGVRIANYSQPQAIDLIESLLQQDRTGALYIVNAHTLNLAAENEHYRALINRAHRVLGDGTGVRWAARRRGVRMKDNLVGTDLVPALFETTAGRGYRYFLLGADPDTIVQAARTCEISFPGWELAGFHHGYFSIEQTDAVIETINTARPHVLLVGMGNPRQEIWIDTHRRRLRVPIAIGVGGLFEHWAGNLKRAPLWMRRQGLEWLQLLLQQPHKWRRYLIGNPKFVVRMISQAARDRFQQSSIAG